MEKLIENEKFGEEVTAGENVNTLKMKDADKNNLTHRLKELATVHKGACATTSPTACVYRSRSSRTVGAAFEFIFLKTKK